MRDIAVEAQPAEAQDSTKFGTFLGVFTPSILTILGVIMYQRFGWVVGNSGILLTLAIIGLAHVISITTGLSVASIATNRTVKVGGNYYIISRSLGLSIGGAIGLALYAALALGVSLYLIGFAEAFLAAFPDLQPYLLGNEKDNIRLIGTVACVALSLLTLYSTSFAMKTQLFVLALIILSLVSIFLGSGVPLLEGESAVELMNAPPKAAVFAVVFAVFFPAVTGFTAGVGMSGDLKDPKRAIPIGTMAAIGVGLVIYLVLGLFIANRASSEQLLLDKNILLRIAWQPGLVTAGVFAATASSALGSILGAPRTLQALALDGIVPRFLARGRKEPRIALLVTILIAEAGILLGELELVGAVISMFFLTCYGFLCLACGLERWASPDFRPQFKVPVWVSLIGAVACFMVMFQIDAAAMFGAILIMGLVYAVLKRRQLVLGSGDTWGGVWSAVVRMGLLHLRQSSAEGVQRNWRPNMIVMARSRTRRELIGFARAIVGDRGLLTHFDLIRNGPTKPSVDEVLEADYPGMFARVQGCDDAFAAIPLLAANAGLAGMETNVMLLGWPRDASTNERYARMIGKLMDLDMSILMMRFDPNRGFGKRERVDIWWDGIAPTGQLMLTLAHLILTSSDWKNARVRVLVTGRHDQDEAVAQKRLDTIISEARVKAEGVLLAPLVDESALADRIRQESTFADLVMIHALEVEEEAPAEFVVDNDRLIQPLGTALLVRPASVFRSGNVVYDPEEGEKQHSIETCTERFELDTPAHPELVPIVTKLERQLREATERFGEAVQQPSLKEEHTFIEAVVSEVDNLHQLRRAVGRRGGRREAARGLVDWAKNHFGNSVTTLTEKFTAPTKSRKLEDREESVLETPWQRRMREGVMQLRQDLFDTLVDLPATVWVETDESDWQAKEEDHWRLRLHKLRVRLSMRLLKKRPPARSIPLRHVATHHLGHNLYAALEKALRSVGVRRFDALRRVRRLNSDLEHFFQNLTAEISSSSDEALDVEAFKNLLAREMIGIEDVALGVSERFEAANEDTMLAVRDVIAAAAARVVTDCGDSSIAQTARSWSLSKEQRANRKSAQAMDEVPAAWEQQHASLSAALLLDVQVASLVVETRRALTQLFHRVRREVEQGPVVGINRALEIMERVRNLREQQESDEEESKEESKGEPKQEEKSEEEPKQEEKEEEGNGTGDLDADLKDAYLTAADELRATWEKPYRPSPRDLINSLLPGLGRAADRVPESVTTVAERDLDGAADGTPTRTFVRYAPRRIAQAFLEQRVVQPAREKLGHLPEGVKEAERVLVDAIRLVAFEVEQGAGRHDLDEPGQAELGEGATGALALGGVLEDRIHRLEAARESLLSYLSGLRTSLLDEAAQALDRAREAVIGSESGLSVSNTQRIGLRKKLFARSARATWRAVEGSALAAVDKISQHTDVAELRRPAPESEGGTLADELLALREKLVPRQDVLSSLPLIYRRMFGRAPLDASDMMRGRDTQLGLLQRMAYRWRQGTGGPIAIIGDPRSGRTSLATVLVRGILAEERTVVRVIPPPGGSGDPEDLNASVAEAVGAREGQGAEGALRAMPPGAVVLVDDLGRWLERTPGGLASLSLWLRIWRRLGERHLFVLGATPYAWRYANQHLGIEESFLGTVTCDPLEKDSLHDLLSLRQRTSDFELQFTGGEGRIVKAVKWRESTQLKRLHERSRGNIGDAIDLWRRSIVAVSERKVTLSVEPEPDTAVLSRLPLRWYAALAGVALHRTVTVARMARIMRLPREEAMGLLNDLERASLLVSDRGGSWSIDMVMQAHVLNALRARGILP